MLTCVPECYMPPHVKIETIRKFQTGYKTCYPILTKVTRSMERNWLYLPVYIYGGVVC